jgi:Domain of unknown function (DUF892)
VWNAAWAESLGHDDIIRLLNTNLNEEKAAGKKLSTVAVRKGVNRKAARAIQACLRPDEFELRIGCDHRGDWRKTEFYFFFLGTLFPFEPPSSSMRSVRSTMSRNMSGLRRKSRGRRISVMPSGFALAGLSDSIVEPILP